MFFQLTDEQIELQTLVRKFASNAIAPNAERWDEESYFPRELFQPAAELGLAGLQIPEDDGGTGLSRLTSALLYEEIGRVDMATAVWLSVHNMAAGIVHRYGSADQRERWLPDMVAGRSLGAFSLRIMSLANRSSSSSK